jgi:Peptidase family S41
MGIGASVSAFIAALILAGVAHAGACGPTDPAGRYEGSAKLPDGSAIAITLNVDCEGGAYAVRFFTDQRDFDAADAAIVDGRLVVKFDNGFGAGVARLTANGKTLVGEADIAGAKVTLSFARAGPAWTRADWRPRLDLTPAQWRADLAYLARELPRRHANVFASLPKEAFEVRVAKLDRRIPSLGPDQMLAALTQLINAIGDGHTGIIAPPDRDAMPLELAQIGGEFRVVAVGPGLGRALEATILKIDGTPIAKAHALALTLTPANELPPLREGRVNYFLARGDMLHGLGITQRRDRARYTVRDDRGQVLSVVAKGLAAGSEVPMRRPLSKPAVIAPSQSDPFWCKSVAAARAVYCDWTGYDDLFAKAKAMWTLIDQAKPGKLIIDMRDNGGGDNTVGEAVLVRPVAARPDLNQKGRLFVLIGPLTFSAAMNNAAQFQDDTNATLVGETIGEKPNSYQEPRQFRLPNSHLTVRVSTRYYAFRKKGPNVVRPDREIIPTWADVKAGHDPQLAWILAQP